MDPLIGRVLDGRYRIAHRLGAGGMGTVYAAHDGARAVAIKLIDPQLTRDREIAKRFLREARLASQLDHPAIVRVFGFGQADDGTLYIAMERVAGEPLADVLAAQVFAIERAVGVAIQLCDALEVAHAHGIIHRDLKPANVMLLPGDAVKVLDFGLAKSLAHDGMSVLSGSNARLGTPLYMAPEQIQLRPIDARTDLYALGCILHEMVGGRPPFAGKTLDQILSNHLYELSAPLPPDVPAALAAVIARTIAKCPEERVGSAAELRELLRACAHSLVTSM